MTSVQGVGGEVKIGAAGAGFIEKPVFLAAKWLDTPCRYVKITSIRIHSSFNHEQQTQMGNAMKTMYKLISTKLSLTVLVALGMASAAFAQESATGTVSGVQNGSVYDYTLTLDNTSSSVSIGSFWYSWTPNISPFFYLPSVPSTASGPTGWTGSPDGDSIQFIASGTSLAPLQSIQFHYVATFAPSQLTGLTGYSYVYHGGIETDAGGFLNVQTVTVPEPSSLSLMAAGVLGLVQALAGWRKLRLA